MRVQAQEPMKAFAFCDDLYLYDLNSQGSPPLAYRCARAGEQQPSLLELLGISARDWLKIEDKLYSMPVCLAGDGGTILLPMFGNIGRFVFVIKSGLSSSALAYLAQSGALGEAYIDGQSGAVRSKLAVQDRKAMQDVLSTVSDLRYVVEACHESPNAFAMEECILRCADLFGVELMLPETVELSAMQGQQVLPEMQPSGQASVLFLVVLLSLMRNKAHARSGWLYVNSASLGFVLQACMRLPPDANTESAARLQAIYEDSGVLFGTRMAKMPIKPPKQYAYMHKKITDPRHPFCARCGCLDERCADCTVLQWAVLPYISDAALLGIKNYFLFEA